VRLAVAKDEAFHFYYQDNLNILRESVFELVDFSLISDRQLLTTSTVFISVAAFRKYLPHNWRKTAGYAKR
jgi:cobyrinic acid a,c-diamide synthase